MAIKKGSAEGLSTATLLKKETKDLGYNIYTTQTSKERFYLALYGFGSPPIGYKNYGKGAIYQDVNSSLIYKQIGTNESSAWSEISGGVSGSGTGVSTFLELIDTPNSYDASKGVRVNSAGNGLEFYNLPVTSDENFTTALKDKLDAIEDGAEKNEEIQNPCEINVNFVQDVDGSSEPVPVSIVSGNSSSPIIDSLVDNGEYKAITNDYEYSNEFNVGANDTLTSIAIKLDLLNNPDGELTFSITDLFDNSIKVSGVVQASDLVNGINTINFNPITVVENSNLSVKIGLNLNTVGTVKWLESSTGGDVYLNVNDEWVPIQSKLTLQVNGYKDIPNTGGVGIANGSECFLGFAVENTLSGSTGLIKICGTVCGFSGLTPYSKYFLSSSGGLTLDSLDTGVMLGVSISDTCILIKQSCGNTLSQEETFHILLEDGGVLLDENGNNLDQE